MPPALEISGGCVAPLAAFLAAAIFFFFNKNDLINLISYD
jgi:hypothetical protein